MGVIAHWTVHFRAGAKVREGNVRVQHHRELVSPGPATGAWRERTVPSIEFIGSAYSFTDSMMRMIEAEFGDVELRRSSRLSELRQRNPSERDKARLVVVEEALARDLVDRLATYREVAGAAGLVLAYHDCGKAREVFARFYPSDQKPPLLFLPMKASIDVWTSVLKLLFFGEAFLPQELVTAPADKGFVRPPTDDTGWRKLTAREKQVLAMVSDGKRNKVIAGDLGLSEHTVKLHLHHIFGKIGVKNRTGATRWYLSRAGDPVGQAGAAQ